MITEVQKRVFSGLAMLPFLFALQAAAVWFLVSSIAAEAALSVVLAAVANLIGLLLWGGLFMVNPNEAKVLQLFGKYVGTVKNPGLRWANPFYSKHAISLRIRNFESAKVKVNDSLGNPIEIAAVVVWKVVDTAEALFEVDDYKNFVHIQSEAALRGLATAYPYDQHEEGEKSLRSHTNEIADHLKVQIQDRLHKAGVEVLEARMSHLAYAQEIAQAMLQRQQATAIIAARQKIVEGAVGMVEMAIEELRKKQVLELDEDRKAAMVSNLLVVLCSDHDAHPIVNAGTIYQ